MAAISPKQLGFGTFILLGLILAFSPVDRMARAEVEISGLAQEIAGESAYISPEDLAHALIDKDPSVVVVDIRSAGDYAGYSIPGSFHLPVADFGTEQAEAILDREKTLILVSNGNTIAGQAWVLLKGQGYPEVYVLAGGMNYWVEAFTNPVKPEGVYTSDELFRYELRKAAGPMMMGEQAIQATENKPVQDKTPALRKTTPKKKKIDEGC